MEGHWKFQGSGGRSLKPNILKKSMGLNWNFQKGGFKPKNLPWEGNGYFLECMVPENIHTPPPPPPPTEGICPMTPHPSGNSNLASYIALNFWVFETPLLPRISNPFCGGSMDIFWNHTITHCPHSTIYREMGEGLPNKQNFPV